MNPATLFPPHHLLPGAASLQYIPDSVPLAYGSCQAALQEMVERSYQGPKHAQVLNIMQSVSSIEQPFIRFEILRS